jgi:hypothetical protein
MQHFPLAHGLTIGSQNNTNMTVGEHEITFEVVVIVLLFDVFVPMNAHPLLLLNKQFVQIYLNVSRL